MAHVEGKIQIRRWSKFMKRIRWYDFITINLFWLALNMRNTAVGSLFQPYLVDEFVRPEIKNTALGIMRTAGLIIALLVQPVMGLLSDRSMSRFGRRRPFLFVGVLLEMVCFAAIAFSWNYASLLIAILLIQFAGNISHGALQGLIPDLVPEGQRGRASAIKAIFELLPLVLIGFTIAPILGGGNLKLAVLVTAVIVLVIMLVTVFTVKEQPLTEKPNIPFWPPMLRVLGMLAGILLGALTGLAAGGIAGGLSGLLTSAVVREPIAWKFLPSPFVLYPTTLPAVLLVAVGGGVAMIVAVVAGVWSGSLATLGKDARKNPAFVWWVVNRLLFLAAVTSIQAYAPYFLMYAFKIDRQAAASMTGTLVMFVGIFTLLSAFPSGWLADKIGRNRLIVISGVLATIGNILLMGTIWLPNITLIYTAGGIIGLATGLFMTANWALGTDLVPPEEAGRYMGISNLAGAGAGIVGTGIGGPVADTLNGYLSGLGYFAIFAAYTLLFALSVVSMRWIRKARE
jgi:MFS family permease